MKESYAVFSSVKNLRERCWHPFTCAGSSCITLSQDESKELAKLLKRLKPQYHWGYGANAITELK